MPLLSPNGFPLKSPSALVILTELDRTTPTHPETFVLLASECERPQLWQMPDCRLITTANCSYGSGMASHGFEWNSNVLMGRFGLVWLKGACLSSGAEFEGDPCFRTQKCSCLFVCHLK